MDHHHHHDHDHAACRATIEGHLRGALTQFLEENRSNAAIEPVLGALQGRYSTALLLHEHGAAPANLMIVDDHNTVRQQIAVVQEPAEVREWLRPDDEFLDQMLDELRHQADQVRRWQAGGQLN